MMKIFATCPSATILTLLLSSSLLLVGRVEAFVSHHSPGATTTRRTNGALLTVSSPRSRLFNQPLATEGDWSAYLDQDNTGFVYYFNAVTGESLWEKPTDSFPDVNLKGTVRLQAQQKQEEYLKSVEEQTPKKGFFQSILETPAEPVAGAKTEETKEEAPSSAGGGWFGGPKPAAVQKKKEEDNWFGSIFAETTTTTAATTVTKEKKPETVTDIKQEKPSGGGGLFGGMLKGLDRSSSSGAAVADDIQVEEAAVEAPIQIRSAAYVLPHPAKVRWGGEDAVFTKGRTFGVFDGVSGAEKLDGVPLYSRTMAEEMKRVILDDDESLSMQELTKRMSQCAEIADKTATGASTAVVASIGQDGFLRALNVGDSACIVIRNNRVVARTREISHYFECPYQLSVDSPDRPRDGTKLNVELQRGDLVLMASDGIFDNLSDEQIVEIIAKEKSPTSMAKRVSEMSRKVSLDSAAPTPYAKLAKRFGDPDYADGLGGKVDDVSCIVVSYS